MIASRVAHRWLQSLSIDGPTKKKRGEGGQSPPTVTLVDVGMSKTGEVLQEWGVYANGQKTLIKSITDENGDIKIHGKDLDTGDGLTAQQAVAFILQGAHPRYYPKPGKTVTLDEKFVKGAKKTYSG